MLHKHGTLSGVIGEATMVKFPYEQGKLFGVTSEPSTKEGGVPHEVTVPSGIAGEVSTKKDKVVPSLGGEVVVDRTGSQKMQWFAKPTNDPQCELLSCKED